MDEKVIAGVYRVTEALGYTPTSETYVAADDTGHRVVVKVVHPPDAEVGAKVRARVDATADLTHPNVPKLIEWGQDGDDSYLAREWVPGADLRAVEEGQGSLGALVAARYGAQMCAALSALHGRGVVHGDVRPENVLLTPEDAVKLVGMIDSLLMPTAPFKPEDKPQLAHYLSPEQARGEEPMPASDVYAVGLVLYEMVTGRLPFDAPDALQVAEKQIGEQPEPPRRVDPDVPASLEAIIVRALEKDPKARYGSAEELRQDLERLIAALQQAWDTGPGARKQRRRVWVWALLGSLVLIAAGLGIAWAAGLFGGGIVKVPDLEGLSRDQAVAAATGAGLTLGDVSQNPDATGTPAGTVVDQSPSPGKMVLAGGTVDLVVAGGGTVAVPDIVGLTEAQAIAEVVGAGLKADKVLRAADPNVEIGVVVTQTPIPGSTQPQGASVTITVSKGAQFVIVPDVLGKAQAEATKTLESAGLKAVANQAFSDTVASGQVISQSVPGGAAAAQGTTVYVVVSKGAQTASVPNVVGQDGLAAAMTLVNAGFGVQVQYSAHSDPGKVFSQSPPANGSARLGSTVTIQVASLP